MKFSGHNMAIGLGLLCLWMSLTGLASLDQQLIEAARTGKLDEVKRLIEAGAAVNASNNDGETPLHEAAYRGHEAVARLLLEKGAAVNAATKDGVTPLHRAAAEGREAVARLLLEKGAAVEAATEGGWTPLHEAAGGGHEAVARLLLEKGAAVEAATEGGWTPLHRAAFYGHEAVARLLLEKGAAVNAADEVGNTPLHVAAFYGHEAVARLLLEKGAAVNAATKDSETPLHEAAGYGHEAVVQLLLEKGAAVDASNKHGVTPLYRAARRGHEAVVRLLLEKGAAVNAATKDGVTPLHVAAAWVVRLLLEKGAAVNAADKDGFTPLHVAAAGGREAVARLLLEWGADPVARAKGGVTPLHMAAEFGHARVIALLLSYDAYAGVPDDFGRTPLDVARKSGKASAVQVLEAALASRKPPVVAAPAPPAPWSAVDVPPALSPKPKPRTHALVVGIERYRNVPPADFASRDAATMERYLVQAMGVPAHQVARLENEHAAKSDLEKYVEQWLPRRVEPGDTVFVYYSGHGAPHPKTGEAYLVPYDGDPAFLETTGYPLQRLYSRLAALPAEAVVVVLDACFSGAGGRSVIARGLRPVRVAVDNPLLAGGKVVALTASDAEQVSGTAKDQGHGLFTYVLLKGLRGEADQDGDGAIGLEELYRYVKPLVEQTARRDLLQEQTPQLLGNPDVARAVRLVERAGR